ncbi:MAG: hypothetical protein VXW17_10190, partial [Pseudomonadota bacterium]|nr:hypothetical protein [Pseudomonadota bacterium]
LPGRFRLSGDARRSMRQIPGILSVQELYPDSFAQTAFQLAILPGFGYTTRNSHMRAGARRQQSAGGLSGEGGITFHFPHGGTTGEQELHDVSAYFFYA